MMTIISDTSKITSTKKWLRYIELALFKTKCDLKSDSKDTYLGMLWWFLEPSIFLFVYYFVFAVIMKSKTDNFMEFLFIGLVAWRWFSASMTSSCSIISSEKQLMKEINVSKTIFPLSMVLADTVKFLAVFCCILIILMLFHERPSIHWFAVLPVILAQSLLILGMSNCFAGFTPFIPDLKQVLTTAVRGMMFISGIFFDITELKPDIAFYLKLNPLADIIINYREILLGHTWPSWSLLSYALIIGISLNVIGISFIRAKEKSFPKVCL
jgi:lipopolysaccharide transport system permease protein